MLSRNLGSCDYVFILVLDSKFGGVIKFRGDLTKLDIKSSSPYNSIGEWVKLHTEILVSPIYRIWNKVGNPNWGDLGALQLLLATFNSIVEFKGPPRMSIESLASDHSLHLQKRRIEINSFLPTIHEGNDDCQGELIEPDCSDEHSFVNKVFCSEFKRGQMVLLENPQTERGFQIKEILSGRNCCSVVSLDHPSKSMTLYVGIHSSQLEPSWEAMGLWYLVQRQTKVLNVMKQQGISSKHLPEIVFHGWILHPGPCEKKGSGDRCDHPLCGTPILVTTPVGKSLTFLIAQNGPFSSEDALRCCRDSLIALSIAAQANIQHSDICPENIVWVDACSAAAEALFYVPVSWEHAVLEDKDNPAMNLQFSSSHALQYRKLCPSSDVESLMYVLCFVCGGVMQLMDSIESALLWRERCWAMRLIQKQLSEVSTLLKAFADYVDSICGTSYPVDYDFWLSRLSGEISSFEKGKFVEGMEVSLRLEDVAESSGTSGGII